MPIYLEEKDVLPEVEGARSVLIVPCRFCPAASMAVRTGEPYIAFFRRLLKTASYERLIEDLKGELEERGVRTGVFESRQIHQFVLCMWTARRRRKLLERARGYDAVVVLGCDGGVQTVRNSVNASSCRVIEGMKSVGVMGIKPSLSATGKLHLELESVTAPRATPSRVACPPGESDN